MKDFPPTPKPDHAGKTDSYTPRERRELLRRVATGVSDPVACPRCGASCAVIRTGPRTDVAYVRDRVVVRCPACRRSVAADVEAAEPR